MNTYEAKWLAQGFKFIAGTDEVGRGCLAGPVVAAAVIFPAGYCNDLINDSKKLSAKKREKLADIIKKEAIGFAVAEISSAKIDQINIKNASRLAMQRAVEFLIPKPDLVLVDYEKLEINMEQESIVRGDEKSVSIAAASILAKVTRDAIMAQFSQQYPEYGFDNHFGYGTKAHYQALVCFGPTPIHRLSFRLK